jgi:lipoprotein-anchoring transpeptidase ErfK/SrfK
LLIALAVAIPVVPIVIGLVVASGGGGTPATTTTTNETFTPVPATSTATSTLSPAPNAIPPGPGALVAEVMSRTTMRATPGGRALGTVGPRTGFGSPEVVLVARHTARWLGVVSELAGNGRLGWIPLASTALSRVTTEIKVSLAARRLTVLDAGRVLQRYTVAIGMPDAPTPTGRFAVTDRLATDDPAGPYGCCIIALSAHSPHAIQGWGGGTRIAIHSTPDTSTLGEPVSHGCMRLTIAEGRWLMYHIPLGTPTVITS